MVYTKSTIDFEWDDNKNLKTQKVRELSFEDAVFCFFDPFAFYGKSDKKDEKREFLIGSSEKGILFVVFIKKIENCYRIISVRKAKKKERRAYENQWNHIQKSN